MGMKLKYSEPAWSDANAIRVAIIMCKFMKWYLTSQGLRFHNALIPSQRVTSNLDSSKTSSYRYVTSGNVTIDPAGGPGGNAARFITGITMFIFTKAWLAPGAPTFTDAEIQTLKTRLHDISYGNIIGNQWGGSLGIIGYQHGAADPFADVPLDTWTSSTSWRPFTTPQLLAIHDNRFWMCTRAATRGELRANEPGTPGTENFWEQIGTVWNSSSTYDEGDIVYHDTSVFRAKKAVPANQAPSPYLQYDKFSEYWTETAIYNQGVWSWQTGQEIIQLCMASQFVPEVFADWEKRKLRRCLMGEGAKKGTGEIVTDQTPHHSLSTITLPTVGIRPGTDLTEDGIYVVMEVGSANRTQWETVFTQEDGSTALGKVPGVWDVVKVKRGQERAFSTTPFGNARIAVKGTVRQARGMAIANSKRGHLIFDPGKGYEKNNPPVITFANGGKLYLGVNDDGSVFFNRNGGVDFLDDSQGETIAWDAWTTEGAISMNPLHENYDKWRRTVITKRLAHKCRREDVDRINDANAPSNKIVDGKKLHEHIGTGSALSTDPLYNVKLGSCAWHYLFGNHSHRNHPTYNSGAHRSSFYGALWILASGAELPEAYSFNVQEFWYNVSRNTRIWLPESGQTGPNSGGTNRLHLFNTAGARTDTGERKSATEVAVPNRMFQDDGEVNWPTEPSATYSVGRRENYWVYGALCALLRLFGTTIREYSNQLTVSTSNANRAAATGIHAEPTETAEISLVVNNGDEPSASPLEFTWDSIRGLNNYNGTANISTLTAGPGNDYLTGTIGSKTVYILRKSPTYNNFSPGTSYSRGSKVWHGSGPNRRLWVSKNNNNSSTPTLQVDRRSDVGWTTATEQCEVWALVVDSAGGTTRILFETDNVETFESGFITSMENMQRDDGGVMSGTLKIADDETKLTNFDRDSDRADIMSSYGRQCNYLQNVGMMLLGYFMNERRQLPRIHRFVKERQ